VPACLGTVRGIRRRGLLTPRLTASRSAVARPPGKSPGQVQVRQPCGRGGGRWEGVRPATEALRRPVLLLAGVPTQPPVSRTRDRDRVPWSAATGPRRPSLTMTRRVDQQFAQDRSTRRGRLRHELGGLEGTRAAAAALGKLLCIVGVRRTMSGDVAASSASRVASWRSRPVFEQVGEQGARTAQSGSAAAQPSGRVRDRTASWPQTSISAAILISFIGVRSSCETSETKLTLPLESSSSP